MALRHLVLARHGNYDKTDGFLTPKGVRQVCEMAGRIENSIEGITPVIVTSPMTRALQSAILHGEHFGNPDEVRVGTCLSIEGGYNPKSLRDINELVKAQDAEVVMLVGHKELLQYYAPFFYKSRTGRKESFLFEEPSARGEAIIFNFRGTRIGGVEYLRPGA